MKLKAEFTRREIRNLNNGDLYVKKDILDKKYQDVLSMKLNGITIKEYTYNSYYVIYYDHLGYTRLKKIYKILKKQSQLVDFIEFCLCWNEKLEDIISYKLSEDLAKEIDKQILNKLIELGKKEIV